MYGTAGKLGRGGGGGRGGGVGKRNIHSGFAQPPLHRPSSATAPTGRLSMGGGGVAPRNRAVSASTPASTSSSAAEETFRLVTGNPLNFAMIIRLVPDLVEQIKRVEAQGGRARIKFDANANNPTGNVISVGDKEFRFTWSPETGELCDIYEERRSGEDGNGLLVESGGAWRKLNVQRVLDESTTNHVKMRSEEAERKLKSRKAIVLDHGNPSMKSQMKALAAAESNPWRMPFKQKKEQPPFKKRKAEPPTVGGPSKTVHKSVLTSPAPSKGRPPASPPSSPPDQLVVPVSPVGIGNLSKAHANIEDTNSGQVMNKISSSEKDTAGKVSSVVQEKIGGKASKRVQPTDMRSVLISLLMENPSKGMSLMAIEKAIGVTIPNSVKQIEPILKKIATFQAPGRYFLKPGVEIANFKRPISDGQSSPEGNRHQSPIHESFDPQPAQQSSVVMNNKELEDQGALNSISDLAPDSLEKVNVLPDSEDLFGEKKVIDNSEGHAGSSSDSGSDTDSESDSSDSGSDSGSHSRSRSRSPAASGSGSSSDSESDASTNSKEASDVDVDIMSSDDDKEATLRLQSTGLGSPRAAINGESGQIGIEEKQDGHISDVVEDVAKEEYVGEVVACSDSVPNEEGERHVQDIKPSSRTYREHQEKHDYLGKINSEPDILSNNVFKHEQSDSSEKVAKGKNKRPSDGKHFEDNPDRTKRVKVGNSNYPQVLGSRTSAIAENHQRSPPDIPFEDPEKGPNLQMTNRFARDGNTGFGSQRGYIQPNSGRSKADLQQASSLVDPNARAKTTFTTERQGKQHENTSRVVKPPERSSKMTGGFPMQKDKFSREAQDDHAVSNYKVSAKFPKEDFGEKHSNTVNSHYKKHEMKEFEPISNSQNSPKDESMNTSNRTIGNGRAKVLQKEPSDCELGEFRESFAEETPGFSKQIERRSSFKKLENTPLMSENFDFDSGKGKPQGKTVAETSKHFPLDSSTPFSGNQESMSKRGIGDNHSEDVSRPHQRVSQLQNRQHPSRTDHNDSGNQYNRIVESSGRNRAGDSSKSLEAAPEVRGNALNKVSACAPQEHEAKRGVIPPSRKESERPKSNSIPDLNDKQKDASLTGSCDGGQRRRESSSDENSCPYSKYDKKEPEIKGPVKDSTQYKVYVEEFQEKYDAYQSIFNILESYREEFIKYTKEYEAFKGRDTEKCKEVARHIKESYHQNVERHKRLKRIFLVLHEELKTLKKMIIDFGQPYVKNNE